MEKRNYYRNDSGDFALIDESGLKGQVPLIHIEVYRRRTSGFYELETSLTAIPEETTDLLKEFGF